MKRFFTLAFLSVLVGLMAHFGIFYFLKIQGPASRDRSSPSFSIQYLGDLMTTPDPVIQEQGLLYDSAPLFMPTPWNMVSEMGRVASLREATEVFAVYPAHLSLPESVPDMTTLGLVASASLTDELPEGASFILSPYGRAPGSFSEVSPSGLELVAMRMDLASRPESLSVPLPLALAGKVPSTLWTPTVLHLQVVEGRTVGRSVIARSSGFTDWDNALQLFVGSLGFYRLLDGGYYQITVFP